MNWLPVLPVLAPLLTAVLFLIFKTKLRGTAVNWSVLGSTLQFLISILLWQRVWYHGTQVLSAGGWPAPFGIVFVADLFSASMVLITGLVGLCSSIYIWAERKYQVQTSVRYLALSHFLLMGVCGSFLTGDLFNLYVWFEVMLMASFVLMAFEGQKDQLEGALKYTVLNLVASFFFLIALGLLYAAEGTLNLAHLALEISKNGASLGSSAALLLLIVAFGMKSGVFPLFYWLPASYHTPRVATSALLAGLLTKVGVYALFRLGTLIFPKALSWGSSLLTVIAILTMVTGVLGAAHHYDIRRILSFHIISQIGYMVLALAIGTRAALAAGVFYTLHHIVVKTNLFFIGGIVRHIKGTTELREIGGLFKENPSLSFLFLIPAMSLAGIPPLSGFFAKFSLIRAAMSEGYFLSVFFALLVGILTLFSMLKIWTQAFWKPHPSNEPNRYDPLDINGLVVPVVILAFVTLIFGFFPEVLFVPAERIATELLDPGIYIKAVLGEGVP